MKSYNNNPDYSKGYGGGSSNPRLKRPSGLIQTSVLVSEDFYALSRQHGIKFSEALRVGISVLLAERGLIDYDNSLNISRQLFESKRKVQEYAEKYFKLEESLKAKENAEQELQ